MLQIGRKIKGIIQDSEEINFQGSILAHNKVGNQNVAETNALHNVL